MNSPITAKLVLGALLFTLGAISETTASPAFNIQALGLTDAEHTRADGYQNSYTTALVRGPAAINETGQVVGHAQRFDGGSQLLGRSVWFFNGASTERIGLIGDFYTRQDGFRDSKAQALNELGQVIGDSSLYNEAGEVVAGNSWFYDGDTTVEIGLQDSVHTHSDGYQDNWAWALNDAGQVIGSSYRYLGNARFGISAWLYNGHSTLNIGLTGNGYTRNDGYRYSEGAYLNEAGQVAGYAYQYDDQGDWIGSNAWKFNGSTTFAIGPSGAHQSIPRHINDEGQVVGHAAFLDSGGYPERTIAWLYDGSSSIAVGLTDSEHTRDDGYQSSVPNASGCLNNAGQAIGLSNRYNGGSEFQGRTAWFYDQGTTRAIGLTDSEHTRDDGYKFNTAEALNEAGHVVGAADRFNGGLIDLGRSIWFFDGTTTKSIGLTDSLHAREDGYQQNTVLELNEAGQVAGLAWRYNGEDTDLGRTAWLYDSESDQTFDLTISSRSDGYAFSAIAYLTDDGLAVGRYELFNELDESLGERVFSFTQEDGVRDLGMMVTGGLEASGWESLAFALEANPMGQIIGYGYLSSGVGSRSAFLLTPVSVAGDFNRDGVVDAADYTVWRDNLGASDEAALNGNGDGLNGVDQADYLLWRANYGQTIANPIGNTQSAPEPTAILMATLWGILAHAVVGAYAAERPTAQTAS